MGLVRRPFDEAPGIAAIREDGFHGGEAGARSLQQVFGAVVVLNIGGVDFDGQQASIGVDQDMALAPVDLLSRVIALESPF